VNSALIRDDLSVSRPVHFAQGKETQWPMNVNLNVLQSRSVAADLTVFLCSAHSSVTVLTKLLVSFYVYVEMSGQRGENLNLPLLRCDTTYFGR
jgi:hypothetical protein